MADAIQRDGAAKQRSRAGMWGSDGEPGRPMSCRRSLQKTADDGFAIWRTPYSETELQSSGVELACGDRTESRGGRCLAGEACRRQRMTVLPYGGRHTARRSCKAAESSWHVGIGRRAERGRCLAGEASRRQRMTVLPYGGRHTARRSCKLR